jgi:hypothetical protein
MLWLHRLVIMSSGRHVSPLEGSACQLERLVSGCAYGSPYADFTVRVMQKTIRYSLVRVKLPNSHLVVAARSHAHVEH